RFTRSEWRGSIRTWLRSGKHENQAIDRTRFDMVSDNQRLDASAKSPEKTLLDSSSLAQPGESSCEWRRAQTAHLTGFKAASIRHQPDRLPLFFVRAILSETTG